ncbi:IS3 family transposase [Leuconostoc citreum]|uniref:IS3 family transposase n=1 Tax=Leuconostoc citreum TaxID=33964 RepID=UPI0021822119|nr:IS3 family transposase [Leuconostoc citreum]
MPIVQLLLKKHFKLISVLRLLKIPKSTYYEWVHYVETNRQREDIILKALLQDIWQNNYKAYGAPRLRLALADLNLHHGINRIRRLMRAAGIYSVMNRRFNKPTTTVDYSQRPNLIKHLPAANAWSMDITYLKLNNGQWVYLASVLELRTHQILSHQISTTMDTRLVVTTLQRALSTHQKPSYLHTDMGSQFTSFGFENLLNHHKIDHSYSKIGHPYDNAKIESFHSLLKREMIYQFRFPSIAHLILDVAKYIHWFNNERISIADRKMKVA